MNPTYQEFCTGCGLCKAEYGAELICGDKQFPVVSGEAAVPDEFFASVCPAGGQYEQYITGDSVWGNYTQAYLGWSADENIRRQASSGGMITSLCIYLLEHNLVNGIIQTKASGEIAYKTETVLSRSAEEVCSCMGSRYSISSPLEKIQDLIVPGETYAFVGKPCDVYSLGKYMQEHAELAKQIVYLFSFFCAGEPSVDAQKKLLSRLQCDESSCRSLQYRGDGWPGYARAVTTDGRGNSISYEESWGKILGRDVRKICRFCFDGIGLAADISCGDAWHLGQDGKPSFQEANGRNVIFARNAKGADLLQAAFRDHAVCLEPYENLEEELKLIQKYQYERRAAMGAMVYGLRLCRRNHPFYNKKDLRKTARVLPRKVKLKRLLGVVKRVAQGKI